MLNKYFQHPQCSDTFTQPSFRVRFHWCVWVGCFLVFCKINNKTNITAIYWALNYISGAKPDYNFLLLTQTPPIQGGIHSFIHSFAQQVLTAHCRRRQYLTALGMVTWIPPHLGSYWLYASEHCFIPFKPQSFLLCKIRVIISPQTSSNSLKHQTQCLMTTQ